MTLSPLRVLRSSPEELLIAKTYRERRAASGSCINSFAHGPRTHGVRCSLCYWRHAYGVKPQPWARVLMLQRELARIANA